MKLGDSFKEEFKFSQNDVISFSEVSRDKNPIHLEEEYSSKTIFKKPIIHGFLGGSIFSKIIGMDFPGEGTIYLKQNMKFLKPMYVDIMYVAEVEIKEIFKDKNRALLSTTIKDLQGNLVIDGDALILKKKI